MVRETEAKSPAPFNPEIAFCGVLRTGAGTSAPPPLSHSCAQTTLRGTALENNILNSSKLFIKLRRLDAYLNVVNGAAFARAVPGSERY